MIQIATKGSFAGLKLVGLAKERCHPTEGRMVRVYFRLSAPPPLGWSYIFTTIWQGVEYPRKRQAGVEGEAVWIECVPEELESCHLAELETTVAQANLCYREKAAQQALKGGAEARGGAELQSKLDALSRTLYPTDRSGNGTKATPQSWSSAFMAKLGRMLRGR